MPKLRPADDHHHDRPRHPPDGTRAAGKPGGGWRRLSRLLPVIVGLLVLGFAGGGLMLYYRSGPQLTMLDGTRDKTEQGGTAAVKLTLRAAADSPGGRVSGKYYFVFSSGTHTAVADANLVGRGGTPFRQTFITPELANEPGPVTFWVEQRDGGDVSRVSPEYTIP